MLYVKLPMKDTGNYTLLIGASVSRDIWFPVKRRLHGHDVLIIDCTGMRGRISLTLPLNIMG